VTPISVDVFARTESVALLRRLVPVLAEADASRIAEAVGHLPLALAQAGGVLATTAPEVYLAQLRDRVSSILSQGSPPTYPTSLAAVVRLASEHLAGQDPAAAQLITICAQLAPEPIPVAWFSAVPAGVLPEPLAAEIDDPILLGTRLRDIASHGLATVDAAGTLQLHRLTSAIIVDGLSQDQRDLSRRQAESVLVAAQPAGTARDPAAWPYWAQLLPHLLTRKATETDNAGWWRLAAHAVAYLTSRGDYAAARPLATAVYQYQLSRLGADHPDTLSAASDLTVLLLQVGRNDEALILGEDTLARSRLVQGADDPGTLRTAGNLANTLRWLGRLDEAALPGLAHRMADGTTPAASHVVVMEWPARGLQRCGQRRPQCRRPQCRRPQCRGARQAKADGSPGPDRDRQPVDLRSLRPGAVHRTQAFCCSLRSERTPDDRPVHQQRGPR
jgi:hypothetical protein